ncbi:MAG: GGDEF domain-containing protein [Geminicoccaceae bacterium]|nr:GGDEF domain-containing protein [Geminicoccaceae bacterium]
MFQEQQSLVADGPDNVFYWQYRHDGELIQLLAIPAALSPLIESSHFGIPLSRFVSSVHGPPLAVLKEWLTDGRERSPLLLTLQPPAALEPDGDALTIRLQHLPFKPPQGQSRGTAVLLQPPVPSAPADDIAALVRHLRIVPDAAFLYVVDNGWTFANPAANALLEPDTGSRDQRLESRMPTSLARLMGHMAEGVIGGSRHRRVEFSATHQTLGMRWWSGLWLPIPGAEGGILGVCAIHRDVSEEIRLRGDLLRERKALVRLASTDPLTRLANRRSFLERFAETAVTLASTQRQVGLIIFDIDRFKSFNDNYGHAVGDRILTRVADAVRQCSRPGDILARWGGEEFILCLPEVALEQTIAVAERLRSVIEQNCGMEHRGEWLNVTASFGVTSSPAIQLTIDNAIEHMIHRADTALYEAKNSGRNRVCQAAVESDAQAPTADDTFLF